MHPQPTAQLLLRALRRFEHELLVRLHDDGYTDVTVAQTNALRHLDPSGMRMNALALDAGISKQAVSQAVKLLVRRDLVRVEPDTADRRARRVVYTERSERMIQRAVVHVRALEAE